VRFPVPIIVPFSVGHRNLNFDGVPFRFSSNDILRSPANLVIDESGPRSTRIEALLVMKFVACERGVEKTMKCYSRLMVFKFEESSRMIIKFVAVVLLPH
jgi:hypothetical protein